MSGFIALYREATEHHLFTGDSARFGAWLWLVAKACWKPTRFDISGTTITLQRGQLCVSRSQLAKAWGWSPSAVERFLTRLKTEQMIGQETGQGRSVITICNYDKYQDVSEQAGQATGQATGQRPDSDRTAKEQGNKGTIEEEEPNGPSSLSREGAKPKARSATNSLIPDDWKPAEFGAGTQCRKIVDGWPPGDPATGVVGELEYQIERFIAHHQARGSWMTDWQAAWKTWVLNSTKFSGKRNGTRTRNAGPVDHDMQYWLDRAEAGDPPQSARAAGR